jgi:hypothetical protein
VLIAAGALNRLLEPYKSYFISGTPLIVHPFSPEWYVGGNVDAHGRLGLVRAGACQDRRG